MSKVVRYKDRETCGGNYPIPVYRIFTPRGDFNDLVGIRGDFDSEVLTWIDKPTINDRARRGTLSASSTKARGFQTLQFYEAILRYVNTVREQNYYDFTVKHRPTALVSYTSARMKSGRHNRDIREVEKIDPSEHAYAAVRRRTIADPDRGEEETYWPYSDLLDWYVGIENWYGRNQDGPIAALDDIAYSVIDGDLKLRARGHFEIAKTLEQEQGANAPYVLPIGRAVDYFTNIMKQATSNTIDRIDNEAIESIRRVASNVGETFYQRDDIGVLIALQNASTANEFLQAFERASIQAQKKASAGEDGPTNWSGQNDIATVLQLIKDPETFKPTKRMFVIHASLGAQFMNAQRNKTED